VSHTHDLDPRHGTPVAIHLIDDAECGRPGSEVGCRRQLRWFRSGAQGQQELSFRRLWSSVLSRFTRPTAIQPYTALRHDNDG
jgi:hypothetical protein